MEICFLGVGEACDPNHSNTSILVNTACNGRILLDCGFTVPHAYFSLCEDPDELDILWISHFHGDHFFGIPLLLLRFWEMGREKPLIICGQSGIKEKVAQVMELAYPDLLKRLQFKLDFTEIEPGCFLKRRDVFWKTAENLHSQRCLSVRLEDGCDSLFYSGDGKPTEETLTLASGCNMIIHESFWLDRTASGHGNVKICLEFAKKAQADNLALVHLGRNVRRDHKELIEKVLQDASLNAFLPESGDVFCL